MTGDEPQGTMGRVQTAFPPSFARTFSSKERRLGMRQGGRCLQGDLWYSEPACMTSRLASVTFEMANKVFIEKTDKKFDFITEILFRFLGFGDF